MIKPLLCCQSTAVVICVLSFCCFKPGVLGEEEQQPARPNIIFALADDLGWNGVGYNGGEALTPNLDEMSRSSGTVRLERHYSGSPVCSPTRGTVLTGRNHNRYCIWGANSYSSAKGDFGTVQKKPLPQTEISVAKVLKRFGYSTACFGKWHLGNFMPVNAAGRKPTKVSHPGLHGFDQWWATEASAPTSYLNCGCFKDTKNVNKLCRNGCTNYHTNDTNGSIISLSAPIMTEDALFIWEHTERFIREQVNLKKPFFLYLPFHNVHSPIVTTDDYSSRYRSNSILKSKQERKYINYLGSISALDDVIGRIRGLLKELNINNNTIFWFTSDNGPSPQYQGRLRGYKKTFYEGGIRVPGLIEWPDVIHKNKKSKFSVVTNDFLPTVYDILGTNPIDDRPLDGISVLPFLQGKINKRKRNIIWAKAGSKGRKLKWTTVAIANQNYKLIAHYDNEGANKMINYELFNLSTDELESTNLATNGNTHYNPIVQKLLGRIEEWKWSVEKSAKKYCLSK